MACGGGIIIDADISDFFGTLDHAQLRGFLDRRVTDGVLRKVIHKWLKAGVLEGGAVTYPESGTPQGGVISPLLANIYLHEVLDEWFERDVRPRLQGRAQLVRYADDFVLVFEQEEDARRVMAVLPKRFGKYGLKLHSEKTRLVAFKRPLQRPGQPRGGTGASHDQRPSIFSDSRTYGTCPERIDGMCSAGRRPSASRGRWTAYGSGVGNTGTTT